MTVFARKFDKNGTIFFRANNKQLWKNYNKILKIVEKLMRIDFESKPVYDDDEKCIKNIYIYMQVVWLQIFFTKKCLKKKHHASLYQ